VLAHWLIGYIHPYPDGNGRMARFLMNVLLASGGYPWTVVRVEDRAEYRSALDRASIDLDAKPFAAFIAERVTWSVERTNRPAGESTVGLIPRFEMRFPESLNMQGRRFFDPGALAGHYPASTRP
jgi:Fic family protein